MTRRTIGYYSTLSRFLQALMTGPKSLKELADKAQVDYDTVRPMIRVLHADGVVHISHWRIDSMNRMSIACYQLGYGIDAPKRKPMTDSQRTMKWKNKRLAAQEKPLVGQSMTLVKNNAVDMALRGWGGQA